VPAEETVERRARLHKLVNILYQGKTLVEPNEIELMRALEAAEKRRIASEDRTLSG